MARAGETKKTKRIHSDIVIGCDSCIGRHAADKQLLQ